MSKRILFFILFSWLASAAFPAFAQQKIDTVYTFRFVPRKDMFYVPWNDNGKELARLLEYIESNKPDIVEGRLPFYVDGYCNSGKSERASLAIVRTRSNRVKSELITRKGLRKNSFITRNHASDGDFVTVRIILPKEKMTADRACNACDKMTTEGGNIRVNTLSANIIDAMSGYLFTARQEITVTDGRTQFIESDLTELLAGFNADDMTVPLTVKGNLLTPIGAGFTATITDWEIGEKENVEIN